MTPYPEDPAAPLPPRLPRLSALSVPARAEVPGAPAVEPPTARHRAVPGSAGTMEGLPPQLPDAVSGDGLAGAVDVRHPGGGHLPQGSPGAGGAAEAAAPAAAAGLLAGQPDTLPGSRAEGVRRPDDGGSVAALQESGTHTGTRSEIHSGPGTPMPTEAETHAGGGMENGIGTETRAGGGTESGIGTETRAGTETGSGDPLTSRIGTETTGRLPLRPLFRDDDTTSAKPVRPDDDDGGPDTVAMPVVLPAGRKAEAGGVVSVQSQSRPRPAPPLDPRLRERPGPVLPGWISLFIGCGVLAVAANVLYRAGACPDRLAALLGLSAHPYRGIGMGEWMVLGICLLVAAFTLGGLGRGRAGHAWVLTLFGEYRGSVRRCGLMWVSPLLLRRRVDVRLRHWRSEPMHVVDAGGIPLQAVVLVVWRVEDTARATLSLADHESYLREQVESAMARVFSRLPADIAPVIGAQSAARDGGAPTLRNTEAVGDTLTKALVAECAPVGIEIFSAQPTRVEYAPEVAAAMRRRQAAVIEAEHRDALMTSVVDAVDETVRRLTVRGLVELDDYERKALVRDLTVAFYTGRPAGTDGV
ncbi:SPFH domain-containing protein [Streptomyces sp. NPDC019396]|uniref:SPFH domain-containing protein n=1 Tax=Streptomyces sp. NPDC019396 TaxID=3154687 RepID=UPI0033F86F2D